MPAVPRTQADLDALVNRRRELNEQLKSTTERRTQLSVQQKFAGLETSREFDARLKALDDRGARLERELMLADDAIAAALAAGVRAEPQRDAWSLLPPPSPQPARDAEMIGSFIAGEALVVVLLGVALWRFAKRTQANFARLLADQSRRFDDLQQAVDVMAIEVERISEGQRYVNKMINEKPALGAGEAQPVQTKRGAAQPVRAAGESD